MIPKFPVQENQDIQYYTKVENQTLGRKHPRLITACFGKGEAGQSGVTGGRGRGEGRLGRDRLAPRRQDS